MYAPKEKKYDTNMVFQDILIQPLYVSHML